MYVYTVRTRARVDPSTVGRTRDVTARGAAARATTARATMAVAGRRATPRRASARARPRAMPSRGTRATAPRDGGRRANDRPSPPRVDRRAVVAGKAAFVLGEAFAFPWLTETATRPRAIGDEALAPGTRAWFASLLPAERDAAAMEAAVAALARGERALEAGNAKDAIEALSKIETLVPREYKLNQRAGLLLSDAWKLAGDNANYLEYKNRVWWWGRGLRWPGWYIIAYLSARSAYFDAKEDDEAAFTMSEAGVVAPLWVGLLFLLVEYGLPDY